MTRWLKDAGLIGLTSIFISHFLITLGRTEDFFGILLKPYYWLDFPYVLVITLMVVTPVVVAHGALDTRLPLNTFPAKRLGFQVVLTLIAPATLTLLLGYVYLEIVLDYAFFETTFLSYEYPVAILIIVVLNLVLLLLSLFQVLTKTGVPHQEGDKKIVLVRQGERTIPVAFSEIAAISKTGDLAVVFTFSGKQYGITESLDAIGDSLDTTFFRANRQVIVHYKICQHYTVNRSGKIDLKLSAPLDREITVSQKKAQEFKAWMKQP